MRRLLLFSLAFALAACGSGASTAPTPQAHRTLNNEIVYTRVASEIFSPGNVNKTVQAHVSFFGNAKSVDCVMVLVSENRYVCPQLANVPVWQDGDRDHVIWISDPARFNPNMPEFNTSYLVARDLLILNQALTRIRPTESQGQEAQFRLMSNGSIQ